VLQWFPNWVKYAEADHFRPKLFDIMPDHRNIHDVGHINFWQAQMLAVDKDAEKDMWGLDKEELAEIEYKEDKIVDSCDRTMLWLRSDMCRLEKLLDVPTVNAVQAYSLKKKNEKYRQKIKFQVEEILE
jgi:hypothetical protein